MATFTITDHDFDLTNTTSQTHEVAIGSGGAERTIIIWVFSRIALIDNGTISAIELDGEATTAIDSALAHGGSTTSNVGYCVYISAADLPDPNATTADLTFVVSNAPDRSAWVVGVTSDAVELFDSASDFEVVDNSAVSQTLNLPVDTADDGFIAAACFYADTTPASGDTTWTNITESVDAATTGEAGRYSAALTSDTTAGSALAVSALCDPGGNIFRPVGVGVSFAPVAAGGLSIPVALYHHRHHNKAA